MTYHRIFNTTSPFSGTGTLRCTWVHPVLLVQYLVWCVVFYKKNCLSFFLLAILLSALLRFSASDCPLLSFIKQRITKMHVCFNLMLYTSVFDIFWRMHYKCYPGVTSRAGHADPSGAPVLSGVRVIRSLILCVRFVDRCLSFCSFSVCPSIYGFWLPLLYLQTILLPDDDHNWLVFLY